jgi:hypothetical protein
LKFSFPVSLLSFNFTQEKAVLILNRWCSAELQKEESAEPFAICIDVLLVE